jgi:hypothetical protein
MFIRFAQLMHSINLAQRLAILRTAAHRNGCERRFFADDNT